MYPPGISGPVDTSQDAEFQESNPEFAADVPLPDAVAPEDIMPPEEEIPPAPVDNTQNEEIERLLKALYDFWNTAEQPAIESRMRTLKLLDNYWQGIQNVFWSEKDGDFIPPGPGDMGEGEVPPKIINIYRPYGEAIIAALSALTPRVRFFPEDAELEADVLTAQAFSKIARKVEADNGENQLLTKALFIDYNQHFILSHVYADDKGYGTTEIPVQTTETLAQDNYVCPQCGSPATPDSFLPEPIPISEDPSAPPADFQCAVCGYMGSATNEPITTEQVIDDFETVNRKKICIDLYGSLNAWVPSWVKNQKETPMVAIDIEKDETWAKEKWPDFAEKISKSGDKGLFYRWARVPDSVNYGTSTIVTIAQRWFRSWSFNHFNKPEEVATLKQLYPDGVYCIFVNDILVEYLAEDLDKCIKISENPLYNSIYAQPRGSGMVDIQDMTTDNVNIINDTIRFGIPITFVRSDAVDLQKLANSQARPGDMVAAKPSLAGPLNDQFYQTKTAQLSDEVPAFQKQLELHAQFVSGAYASIYGGALQGAGGTLGEYESSKNQSLQRLQINWRLISKWWADTMLMACQQYVKNVNYDEKFVESQGNSYINTWIKLSELEGHVGKVVAETSDQFPTTWSQMRDIIQNLLTMGNEEINAILSHPKNAPMVRNLIGLPNMYIPGSEDVDKQNLEIALLVKQQPNQPSTPEEIQNPEQGPNEQQMQQQLPPQSSVPPDPDLDNHEVHIEICDIWLKSPTALAQKDTPAYQNVYLHRQEHQMILQMQMMQQMQQQMQMQGQNKPPEKEQPPSEA